MLCYIVSYRYYLLVVNPGPDADMTFLRQRSKKLILMSFLPFVTLCQLPWLCILLWNGWPEVPISDLDTGTFLWLSSSNIALSNLPDLASILIYIKMVCHFHWKRSAVQPEEPMANFVVVPEDLADFGGIWVGGDIASLEGGINPSAGEVKDPAPPNNTQEHGTPKKEHDIKSVMRVLKWHVLLCMVDVILALSSALICSPIGHGVLHACILASGVWIPFLIIKNNFQNLEYLRIVFCAKMLWRKG